MDRREDRIRKLFEANNRQDANALVALLSPAVDFYDYMAGGGRLVGHDAIHAALLRQYQTIRAEIVPLEMRRLDDGRYVVRALSTVHSMEGQLWSENMSRFEFAFDSEDRILRLDPAD